jgi:molybdopterin synthase sulfur carrier subunit
LFFGQLTEISGSNSIAIPFIKNTDELRQYLFDRYPSLQAAPFLIAVDREIINENIDLAGKKEIALLPPYAGG